jgi:hypothetical protein
MSTMEYDLGRHKDQLAALHALAEPQRSVRLVEYVVATRESSVYSEAIRAEVLRLRPDFRHVISRNDLAAVS